MDLPILPVELWENLPPQVQAAFLAQQQMLTNQQTQIQQLQQQVQDLLQQLNQNSRNSSKPPSTDPPWQTNPAAPKAKSGKKRGGQTGHFRHQRELLPVEQVDSLQSYYPSTCQKCQGLLQASDHIGELRRQQVWEIESVKAHVTEQQWFSCKCSSCGHITTPPHPQTVPSGQFGPHLTATVATLHGRYRLSAREVQALVADLWGVEMSVGAIMNSCSKVSAALAESYQQVQQAVQTSCQANVDETSWDSGGKQGWLWVAVSRLGTLFRVAGQRSRASFEALVGRDYGGNINSDRYNAYYGLEATRHQLCWAHLIRNICGIGSRAGPAEEWAKQALELSGQLFERWHRYKAEPRTAERRGQLQAEMAPIRAAFKEVLAAGESYPDKRVVTFSRQVGKLEEQLWVFVAEEGIEPTNNAAERALRPAVIWRKTCFGSQSEMGERFWERMLTVAASCPQQGLNFFEYVAKSLAAVWSGQAVPLVVAVN